MPILSPSCIVMITTEKSEEPENAIEDNTIEVILEKNRAGARGTVKLLFQKEYNKFSSIAQFEES